LLKALLLLLMGRTAAAAAAAAVVVIIGCDGAVWLGLKVWEWFLLLPETEKHSRRDVWRSWVPRGL
jgi:hypothetical protein